MWYMTNGACMSLCDHHKSNRATAAASSYNGNDDDAFHLLVYFRWEGNDSWHAMPSSHSHSNIYIIYIITIEQCIWRLIVFAVTVILLLMTIPHCHTNLHTHGPGLFTMCTMCYALACWLCFTLQMAIKFISITFLFYSCE